jgi:2-dehydro-3-deoxy-D-arabinonate dehydratase
MLLYRTNDQLLAVEGTRAVLLALSLDDIFMSADPGHLVREHYQNGMEVPSPDLQAPLPPPVQSQEIWAAGVTYFRSRVARMDESKEAGASSFYDRVYEEPRPELFFKATGPRTRGHLAGVRIRSDATWSVPEPELTLAVNRTGRIFGFTIGNDMSSRDIEGDNMLYLPQAKVYRGSLSLGPGILLADAMPAETGIHITITRDGVAAFEGSTTLAQLKRRPEELVGWLFRENEFPAGCFLLTGTGIVPPGQWTLRHGDVVTIRIDGIGTLENPVEP